MDASFRLRPASEHDLDSIVRIEAASFSSPWSRASLAAMLPEVFIVLADREQVSGYGLARAVDEEGEIMSVAVDPAVRRLGLGRRLVRRLIDELEARGVQDIWLEVRRSNTAARELYGGVGFNAVGIRPRYYRKPAEDAIMMVRRGG